MKAELHRSNKMFDITGADINYSNIKNMYTTGNGIGIQVNNESIREEASSICNQIADLFYKLDDVLACANKK